MTNQPPTNGTTSPTNQPLSASAPPPQADQGIDLVMVPHIPVSLPPPPDPPKPDPANDDSTQPPVSEEIAIAAIQKFGIPQVSRKVISELASIGLHLGGAGVIRLNRADVFVSQRQLDQAIQLALLEMEAVRATKGRRRPAALTTLAAAVATLVQAKTKAQSLALEIERTSRPPGSAASLTPIDQPPPKACFAANENIILTNEVHLHSKEPAKPEKT